MGEAAGDLVLAADQHPRRAARVEVERRAALRAEALGPPRLIAAGPPDRAPGTGRRTACARRRRPGPSALPTGRWSGTGGTDVSPAPRLVEPGRRPPRRCVRPAARSPAASPAAPMPSRRARHRPLAVRADTQASAGGRRADGGVRRRRRRRGRRRRTRPSRRRRSSRRGSAGAAGLRARVIVSSTPCIIVLTVRTYSSTWDSAAARSHGADQSVSRAAVYSGSSASCSASPALAALSRNACSRPRSSSRRVSGAWKRRRRLVEGRAGSLGLLQPRPHRCLARPARDVAGAVGRRRRSRPPTARRAVGRRRILSRHVSASCPHGRLLRVEVGQRATAPHRAGRAARRARLRPRRGGPGRAAARVGEVGRRANAADLAACFGLQLGDVADLLAESGCRLRGVAEVAVERQPCLGGATRPADAATRARVRSRVDERGEERHRIGEVRRQHLARRRT